MGLDTTHDAWHGSYGGFAHWRNAIGRAIGWEIEDRKSGSGEGYVIPEGRVPEQGPLPDETVTEDGETYTIRWSSYDNKVWLGHWDEDPKDVLDVLMVHSDCEGIIPHRFLAPLACRLTGLLSKMGDWDDRTKEFIDGLRRADAAGEDVGFH